ncbi:gliding motility-associated C-terminal domain-containing protein [Aquimarina sp. U1-2]|uniref:gliding motility-associated C-terminal domain-containing protein n=1 Tax=Aquimarina sp. U1-2 TaxID=2823141 RepID=UPI001AEC8254|nr:gliding motility-associated C-terminal domain-containing protein [Aquimarina sp. U1-2]MBP2833581.1 gliding motility-associated C-terminal domain-containing protein [Aquimarina sp. U1-2]
MGPYSGVALPRSGALNVNAQGCDSETFLLFSAFVQDNTIPPPHANGEWIYNGSSPNFVGFNEDQTGFEARIPYGFTSETPFIDQEAFEFTYRVPGILPCDPFQETTVRIAIVRQVDAGSANFINICEDEILAGDYDADINLRDDIYLNGEDNEGIWLPGLDPTGQIADENDPIINLKELYTTLTDGGRNLRFGCKTYDFHYKVDQRARVCENDTSIVSFKIYEQLRPFRQPNPPPRICTNQGPGNLNLFSLLEFSEETNADGATIDFTYASDSATNWRLLSGPAPSGFDLELEQLLTELGNPNPEYTHLGTINTQNAPPGTYVFEYAVSPAINCKDENDVCDPYSGGASTSCLNPCAVETATVTIEILPFDYAGENTSDISICESVGQVDLRSLLNTNGFNTISNSGVWTNIFGDVVPNRYSIQERDIAQTLTFTYTTTNASGCEASATLVFTVDKEPNAGEDGTITLCSDDLTVTLFEVLGGDPDTTGVWTGPFGYTSPDHLGFFDASDTMLPVLGEGVYTYTVPANGDCSDPDQAIVTISVVEPLTIGTDRAETFCKIDGRVNLFSLLDRDTPRGGTFEDTDNTGALLADGVLEFETLTNEIYNFRYVLSNAAPCDQSSLIVSVQIVDLPIPNVPDQEFCILDAVRLDDIEVDVLNYNWYDSLESSTAVVDNPILLDNQIYYITNVDVDGCESERLQVTMNILNTGERSSTNELCAFDFQDGVTPNGDNQNDTFDLLIEDEFNLPEAFPDFELKIFNRYGTLVYDARKDTEEFRGESNVSVRLGDDLPSGTYFYIFTPNFENNLPIQGSFYLSR